VDLLSFPTGGDENEEDLLERGGLIEELRRERSAKKWLDMNQGGEEGGSRELGVEPEVAVKGKRSKSRKKDDDAEGKRKKDTDVEGKKRKKEPKKTAGSKKLAEKVIYPQLYFLCFCLDDCIWSIEYPLASVDVCRVD
jgi:hypothetical protein